MSVSQSKSIFLISTVLFALFFHVAAFVSLTSMRTISGAHVTKVVLSCVTSGSAADIVLYRRVGSINERVIANTTVSSDRILLNFDLTPENEGYYRCEINSGDSSNEVELVGKLC